MDSFYVIKKNWDKQHKSYMIKLKAIYENSKASKKKEEDEQNILLKVLAEKLKNSNNELKCINLDIEAKRELSTKFDIRNKTLCSEIIKNQRKINGEEERIEAKNELLKDNRREFGGHMKKKNEKLSLRQEEIDKSEEDADISIIKNNKILENIKKEKESLDRQKNAHIEKELALNDRQEKFNGEKKAYDKDLGDNKTLSKKIDVGLKRIAEGLRSNDKKKKILDDKEKQQNEKDRQQKDKDIELNLKDIELNKKEVRIDSLIRIKELNG